MKIKKLVAVLFALCLAVGVMALSASAAEIVASGTCGADGDNLTWTLDDEGTLTISGEGEMAGYACKQWNMYDIYSVIINEGVTSIGSHAFYECYELTDISIPLGVLKIGSGAFYCCTKLTEIELPDTVTRIDDSAFSLCRKINDLVIPNSVNKIGIYSFSGCKSLEKIIFVGAAPTIGSYAFENVTASIYYSADDASWTEDVRLNYGGSLMWLPVSKPHITAQPEIIYARYGESAEVSVKVDGVAITYQWYISADGENFTEASGNGDTYSVLMDDTSRDQYVYCVVTDVFGNTVQSDTVQLHMAATITEQPEDTKVKLGGTAEVSVTAVGDGLTYAWYAAAAGSDTFTKSSTFTGNTYSVEMTENRNGRRVYCVVTDQYGNSETSNTVTLSIQEPPVITTQPKLTFTKQGATAKTTVKAVGDGLTYQWYFKSAGQKSYSKSSCTSATYSTKMSSVSRDRIVYCVIKDKYGNSVTSTKVYLRMAATITKQPTHASAAVGSVAKTKVTAVGDGLTYQWYLKNPGATKFSKSSVTSSTYSAKMTAANDGRQVYCVVTDKYGKTAKSNTVTLGLPVTITTQPKLTFTKQGATAETTVKADGDGLTYQWYIKNSGASSYTKSSCTNATYATTMSSKSKDRIVYCVIKDQYGNSVTSSKVYLRMAATITTQPKDVMAAKGSTAKVTVKAVGDGLTYTWYFKNAGASKFSKSTTCTGTSYSAVMNAARDGRQVYCVVTDKYGKTAKSNVVTLSME